MSVLSSFVDKVNGSGIPVVPGQLEIPTQRVMAPTHEVGAPVSAVDSAFADPVGVRGVRELSGDLDIGQRPLSHVFQSYDDLASCVLGNVFRDNGINSVNADFFGDCLKYSSPPGFSLVDFGSHLFFVENGETRLMRISEICHELKAPLVSAGRHEYPFARGIEINHAWAWTLTLTPPEIRMIRQSFPDYKFEYVGDPDIAQARLAISLR
jgi:hypothetical protein